MKRAGTSRSYSGSHAVSWLAIGVILLGIGFSLSASGQTYPVYIGTRQPIQDEFGENLRGYPSFDVAQRDRVEILSAPDGVAHTPLTNGAATGGNAVWSGGVSSIGSQVAPQPVHSGLFAVSLEDPVPLASTRLFVRVFNAPTREAASFYADSAVFAITTNLWEVYDVVVGPMQPLDPNDDDGDGLNNSLEKSLGSNPNNPDSDGDGRSDYDEYMEQSPLNEASYCITSLHVDGNGHPVVGWEATPDKHYRIEYKADLSDDGAGYEVWSEEVMALDLTAEVAVTNGPGACGFFRIRCMDP